MSKPLPTCGFEWMNEEELENWKNHSCILEVGLVYPKDLHDLHNDSRYLQKGAFFSKQKVRGSIPGRGDRFICVLFLII